MVVLSLIFSSMKDTDVLWVGAEAWRAGRARAGSKESGVLPFLGSCLASSHCDDVLCNAVFSPGVRSRRLSSELHPATAMQRGLGAAFLGLCCLLVAENGHGFNFISVSQAPWLSAVGVRFGRGSRA